MPEGDTIHRTAAALRTALVGKPMLRFDAPRLIGPGPQAGHPPALSLNDGHELIAPTQGTPLGIRSDPGCIEGSGRSNGGGGLVLYTDGLTEARHGGQLFGLEGASAALSGLDSPSPTEAIGVLRERAAEFAHGILTDDICLLAARIT